MISFSLLSTLLYNAALLMSMVVVCGMVIQNYDIRNIDNSSRNLLVKIATGLIMGLIGIATIMASMEYSDGVILDTRSVLLGLVGLFFGGVTLFITVLATVLFRLYLGGSGALAGALIIIASGLIGMLWYQFRKPKLDSLSAGELLLFGFLVHAVMMLFIMQALPPERVAEVIGRVLVPVLVVNPLAMLLVGKLLSNFLHKQRLSYDLVEKEQRLRIAISASGQDMFEMNLQTGEIVSISEKAKSEKYPLITIHDNVHDMLKEVHPDDRKKLILDLARAQKGDMEIWEAEFRQRTKDDDWAWIFVAGQLVSRDWENMPLIVLGTFMNITHRKKREEELLVFRELIDNSSDALEVIDPRTGRFLDVNRTGCQELGYSREELLQMHIFDIDSEVKIEFSSKKTMDELMEVQSWEGSHRRKDGTCYPVDVNLKFVSLGRDYFVAMVRNATERKLAEETNKITAMAYENSREAMMVIDANKLIMDVNPTFCEITGYMEEEVIGKSPAILNSDQESEDLYKSIWQQLDEQGHWAGEVWHKRKNDEVFPEWLSLNAVYDDTGNPYRWVGQFTDISEKKQAEKKIWHQANIDNITSLPNRSMFIEKLNHEIKRSKRSGSILALLYLDLDRFKEVNDNFGHDMGDQLLILVAERLKDCLRETDTVARLGGDEFTIILTDLKVITVLNNISQKIIDLMATPFSLKNNDVYISASIGITLFPDDASTPDELLKNADQAMYMAKKFGRNQYFYFTSSLQQQANRRSKLLTDLRLSHKNNMLEVYYQPIINLKTGKITKAEALLRWNHPEEGFISPSAFIPIAEESGLIISIGDKVLEDTLLFLKRLQNIDPNFQVSINKSPIQFSSQDDKWMNIISEGEQHNKLLVVEITEGLLLESSSQVQSKLQAMFASGLEVALDDFGTGYSSLAYLKKFNISYIKIDQSFVQNLDFGNEDHTLCVAMITMAHSLGIKVIAEGIETDLQRKLLMKAGCDFGQGYLFAKPMPESDLESFLTESAFFIPGDFPDRNITDNVNKVQQRSVQPPDLKK
jgi:diguanylate cyclase (GGDEF)-like protein/PAS domain S-box-containing protein